MNHLIITAHPGTRSFNHSVAAAYTGELEEHGQNVARRDLYALGFNPVLSARDMTAMARGKLPRDIRAELKAVKNADVITMISPLWWRGFPAVLKGYIDRVFTAGVGYLSNDAKSPKSLSGRKAVIITTSEATVDELKSNGTLRALKADHKEMMDYCGIDLLGQLYLGGVPSSMSRAAGEQHLETIRRFVQRTFK